jgi:hypothetical protein
MTRLAPQWLHAPTYEATVDRQLMQALWPRSAVQGLKVNYTGTAALTVDAGRAVVPGHLGAPSYLCASDAQEVVNIPAAPAGGGQTRTDLVVAMVRDSSVSGVSDDWLVTFISGVAGNPGPVPATPDMCTVLAQVTQQSTDAFPPAAGIVDVRPPMPALPDTKFRFARVVCDGSGNSVSVNIPYGVESVSIEWFGRSLAAAGTSSLLGAQFNNDATAAYSYAIHLSGTVVQIQNVASATYLSVGTMRPDYFQGGRVDLPHCCLPASVLRSVLWHSHANNTGLTGQTDSAVATRSGAGHYYRGDGGPLTSIQLFNTVANFAAGSVFDFFGST